MVDKTRLKRCYELAGNETVEMSLFENEPEEYRLVHGTVGPNDNPHAWIEWDTELEDPIGRKFSIRMARDPVTEIEIPWGAFENVYMAKRVNVYTVQEACKIMSLTEHYGPW